MREHPELPAGEMGVTGHAVELFVEIRAADLVASCLYSRTFGEFLRDAEQASRPQSVLYGSSRGPRVCYCASRHYGG
jgi:hypothetical protein